MLEFMYYLCIAPLETAMRSVLFAAHALTGSWGTALVLLSLAVNIALIPIYHLAETWQEAERDVQRKMAPKLAEIQEVFTGRERWMFTRALYRLHGYSPIFALRTIVGLLIQIPFFFAAYRLCNTAPELVGQHWLFLSDLARPDGLVRIGTVSINVLPFVMTAVNVLSAAVYTSRLTRRETIQLYGLAALFLVLLYPSSSALLLYWTCNNLFSLGKNIVYTRVIYARIEASFREDAAQSVSPNEDAAQSVPCAAPSSSPFPAWADIGCILVAGGLFAAAIRLRKGQGLTALPMSLCIAALLLAALALFLRCKTLRAMPASRHSGLAKQYGIIPLLVALVVSVCIWKLTSFKKLADPMSWAFFRTYALTIGLLAGYVMAREPFSPLLCRVSAAAATRIKAPAAASLFAVAVLILLALVCWYTPATLYASDTNFFYESRAALFGQLTFRALLFALACRILYGLAHPAMRPALAVIFSWAAVCALLFTFVAAGDYGTLDAFVLQDTALLKTRLAFLVDMAVGLAAALVLFLAVRRPSGVKHLTTLLQGIFFALCLLSLHQVATAPPSENTSLEQASSRLPDYNDALFGFSRNGTNTLIVMLDMFTGSHLERILEQSPELRTALDGFTYYPDTLAPGATTLLSIGAILGGEDYTAPAINARRERSLKEELHKAFATLPDIFVPRGHAVALADVDEMVPSLFNAMCAAAPQTLVVGKSIATAYTGYWRKKKGLPSPLPETRAPFLGSVGLFRAAPWTVRNHIYYDGSWMGTQTVIHNPSESALALLDVLPHVANTRETRNTLKYITSQIAHYPWRLDEATCMPVEGTGTYTTEEDRVIREHLANERCGLLALARWFAWMRREQVYDNTLIILVSDHDGNDSPKFGATFDDLRPDNIPWKPDALLLVKGRNSRGPLRTDERPMSAADIVPLICAADGPCPDIASPDPLRHRETPRIRTHSAGLASIRRHGSDHFKTRDYRVTGSATERDHWEQMGETP